jgi:hypothetical protein
MPKRWSPTWKVTRPSITYIGSSSRLWTWSGGEKPGGTTASMRPKAPPVVCAEASTLMRVARNHTVSASSRVLIHGVWVSVCVTTHLL